VRYKRCATGAWDAKPKSNWASVRKMVEAQVRGESNPDQTGEACARRFGSKPGLGACIARQGSN
jgi:hypothetical protein